MPEHLVTIEMGNSGLLPKYSLAALPIELTLSIDLALWRGQGGTRRYYVGLSGEVPRSTDLDERKDDEHGQDPESARYEKDAMQATPPVHRSACSSPDVAGCLSNGWRVSGESASAAARC